MTTFRSCKHQLISGTMIFFFFSFIIFLCLFIVLVLVVSGSIKADITITFTFDGRIKFVSEFLFGVL